MRPVVAGTLVTALALFGCSALPAAGGASPPPGATARCRDGTYSFSQHRQGTCSHHGGVAVWLRAGTGSGSSSAPGETGAAGRIDVGATVLLDPRTRSSGCVLGSRPDRRCSPGAYYSGLTRGAICAAGFRTGAIRNVPESEKFAVEAEYGLEPGHYGRALEIDHIVPLELGGSNDIANLFPEQVSAAPGYRFKDRLENELHRLVCAGRYNLRSTQTAIARDWQRLYAQVYGVEP